MQTWGNRKKQRMIFLKLEVENLRSKTTRGEGSVLDTILTTVAATPQDNKLSFKFLLPRNKWY